MVSLAYIKRKFNLFAHRKIIAFITGLIIIAMFLFIKPSNNVIIFTFISLLILFTYCSVALFLQKKEAIVFTIWMLILVVLSVYKILDPLIFFVLISILIILKIFTKVK